MTRLSRPGPAASWIALAAATSVLGLCAWSMTRDRGETAAQQVPTPARTPAVASRTPEAPAPVAPPSAPSTEPAAPAPAAVLASGSETPAPPSDAPASAGMIVGIDPETGQLGMPTPEQMRHLFPLGVSAQDLARENLPTFQGPGGAIGVDVQGHLMEYAFVRIGPDGKQTLGCASDPAVVKKALATPPPPAPRWEEQ